MKLEDYDTIIRKDRYEDGYGGVCAYFRKDVIHLRREDLEHERIELMWNEVKSIDGNFLMGVLYRPPNAPNQAWDLIESLIENAVNTNMLIILGGDWNDDVNHPNSKVLQICARTGLVPLNYEPTHVTDTSSKCIDIVITNCAPLFTDIVTSSPCMSNHSPVIVSKKTSKAAKISYKREIHVYRDTD